MKKEQSAVLILLPGILFFFSHKLYPLFLYPFIILFVVSIFIKKESIQKTILYSSLVLFVILLISGSIIGSGFIVGGAIEPYKLEYKILYCENTKLLNQTEKQLRFRSPFNQKYISEEWNICDNPSCHKICMEYCKTMSGDLSKTHIELRGDKPSCICGCSY